MKIAPGREELSRFTHTGLWVQVRRENLGALRACQSVRQFTGEASKALRGGHFRAGREVEDLDGNPATVTTFDERLENRPEIDVAHAGAAQIRILGVEMAGGPGEPADQGGHGLAGLATLSFHVHVQLEVRVSERLDQVGRLPAGVQEGGKRPT